MQKHGSDVSVCKFVLSALGNLCIIDNNKQRLGAIGQGARPAPSSPLT